MRQTQRLPRVAVGAPAIARPGNSATAFLDKAFNACLSAPLQCNSLAQSRFLD